MTTHQPAALPDLTAVIAWLENGCDPSEAVKELKHYQSKLRALTTSQPAQAGEVDEREAFEAWFDDYYDKACAEFGGIDCTDPKGIAEDAWQARASLPAPQQATPEPVGEVVYQYQSGDGKWIDQTRASYDYNVKHGNTVRVLYTHPAPGVPDVEDLRDRLVAISAAVADCDDRAAQSMLGEILRLLAAAQAKGADPEDLASTARTTHKETE